MKKFVHLPIILACSTYTSFASEKIAVTATPANTPIEKGEGLLKEVGLNKVSKSEPETVPAVDSDLSFNSSPPIPNSSPPIPIRNARKVEVLESDESTTSSSAPSSESPSKSSFVSWLTIKTYDWTSNPKTEKRRFPNLTLERLIELCTDKDPSWKDLINKSFPFETSSTENGADHYLGEAIIESIDYGTAQHPFLSQKEGFGTVSHFSEREKKSPYNFFKGLLDKNQNPIFHKGEPFKGKEPFKGEDDKTRTVYVAYNTKGTRYIKVTLRRQKKS